MAEFGLNLWSGDWTEYWGPLNTNNDGKWSFPFQVPSSKLGGWDCKYGDVDPQMLPKLLICRYSGNWRIEVHDPNSAEGQGQIITRQTVGFAFKRVLPGPAVPVVSGTVANEAEIIRWWIRTPLNPDHVSDEAMVMLMMLLWEHDSRRFCIVVQNQMRSLADKGGLPPNVGAMVLLFSDLLSKAVAEGLLPDELGLGRGMQGDPTATANNLAIAFTGPRFSLSAAPILEFCFKYYNDCMMFLLSKKFRQGQKLDKEQFKKILKEEFKCKIKRYGYDALVYAFFRVVYDEAKTRVGQ